MSSGDFVVGLAAVCPGGVFVVGGVVSEAAVEDADETVAERAEGLVVVVAGGSVLVVVGPAAGAGSQ